MIHSPFGWSYPPGCNSVPGDENIPCMICWQYEDRCPCPVCDVCETIGDPKCYMHHGLKLTEQQVSLRLKAEIEDRIAAEDEDLMLKQMAETEEFWHQDNGNENE